MFLKSWNKKQSTLPSIISSDTKISGDIISQGEVQIDGEVIGNIHARFLTIHKHAHIKGNIIAEMLDLHGRITGNVQAHTVHMLSQSQIEGDVIHEHIAIEAGAFINGKCQRQNFTFAPPPLSEANAQDKAQEKSDSDTDNVYQYPAHQENIA